MRISDWSSDVCSSDLHADDDAGRWCRGTVPVGSRGVRHAVCDLAEKRRADHHAGTIRQGSRRPRDRRRDRKSVVQGQSVTVRVDLGGRRIIKIKNMEMTKNAVLKTYEVRRSDD